VTFGELSGESQDDAGPAHAQVLEFAQDLRELWLTGDLASMQLSEVAEVSGLSKATVYRALSDPRQQSPRVCPLSGWWKRLSTFSPLTPPRLMPGGRDGYSFDFVAVASRLA
jgi:hypothetical protein